jgi:hypothetical protein
MRNNQSELFFQLVRYSIDERNQAPQIEADEWETMFDMARKQSIIGVVFNSVQCMGLDANIPRQLKMNWFFQVNKIKNRNILVNQCAVKLVDKFRKEGFDCCVLKGQGNAMMYPDPYVRTSGDIDLQVKGGRVQVVQYVKKRFPHTKTAYQHVDYPIFKKVPVEVHYLPVYMNNPVYNKRLKKWFDVQSDEMYGHEVMLPDDAGQITVPSLGFNIVFQLAHLMHHFLDEGIGLRHMIDYYYLLRKVYQEKISLDRLQDQLDRLGLRKFAGAVMYIMRDVLGLEEACLIVPVDKARGETLLNEILRGGNFGKHSGLTEHSLVTKHFIKYWRTMHFIREYPAEALCEPVFRTWHFFWRLKHS